MRAAAREVVRLRDQLARLEERLALQEGDLHGAGEDVARGMDVQAGTIYCGPAVINSTGASATMSSTGSASASLNDRVLVASDLPQNSFGYFLTSRTQGFIAHPGGSQGNLCLGAPIGRYVGPGQIQNSGAAGAIMLALDLTQTPTGLVAVQVGEVWSFTAWYRDSLGGVAVSNFADGYEVTFE